MTTKDKIKQELNKLTSDADKVFELLLNANDKADEKNGQAHARTFFLFSKTYQDWYSRALKIVALLGVERLDEFRNYYLADPKRKGQDVNNYSIQDFIKGIGPRNDVYGVPAFDGKTILALRFVAQRDILNSLSSRIDGVLSDVEGHLFAELQDEELRAAHGLISISPRAAGALAGVVLERHLQRAAQSHGVSIAKKHPTIADLNDPLKNAGVYELATWRKIQFFADLRNLCSHSKDKEPTKEQVKELISGVDWVVKNIF